MKEFQLEIPAEIRQRNDELPEDRRWSDRKIQFELVAHGAWSALHDIADDVARIKAGLEPHEHLRLGQIARRERPRAEIDALMDELDHMTSALQRAAFADEPAERISELLEQRDELVEELLTSEEFRGTHWNLKDFGLAVVKDPEGVKACFYCDRVHPQPNHGKYVGYCNGTHWAGCDVHRVRWWIQTGRSHGEDCEPEPWLTYDPVSMDDPAWDRLDSGCGMQCPYCGTGREVEA